MTGGWEHLEAQRGEGAIVTFRAGATLRLHASHQLSDATQCSPASADGGLLRAILDNEGAARVETTTALPGLLVSREGMTILPAEPGPRRPTTVSVGDRLILCGTSSATPPAGFLRLLGRRSADVLERAPAALLEELLDGMDDGAAAVVTRTGHPTSHSREETP